MATNLVSQIFQFLTAEIASRVASSLGLDKTSTQKAIVGDVDVGELSKSAVNDLYTSLVGMKDAAAAQADLPGLTKASSEFDQLDSLLNQLSPENRKMLADVFASIKPNLDQLLDKAVAIPGVGAVIKPTWMRSDRS